VNRLDQETEKEARAHKGCRAIQGEEEEEKRHNSTINHLYIALSCQLHALAALTTEKESSVPTR
jgi:hypothetical protein